MVAVDDWKNQLFVAPKIANGKKTTKLRMVFLWIVLFYLIVRRALDSSAAVSYLSSGALVKHFKTMDSSAGGMLELILFGGSGTWLLI